MNLQIFEMEDKELGYYFFRQRTKKDLTIRKLSTLSGVSQSYISRFESGTLINISLTSIKKLCKVLNLDLKYCIIK